MIKEKNFAPVYESCGEDRDLRKKYLWYRLRFAAFALIWNEVVYLGARMLTQRRVHYNLQLPIEEKIPFVPWTIVIYFGCFLLWAVNYVYAACQEDAFFYRFYSADFFAKLICFFCFLAFPTTNVRPVLENQTIWDVGMHFLYWIDSPDNLFPSIHCLCSWLAFIAVRRRKNVPKAYQIFSLLFALLVCISTLTTKQHVLADVVVGVFLAEFSYQIVEKIRIADLYKKIIPELENKRNFDRSVRQIWKKKK